MGTNLRREWEGLLSRRGRSVVVHPRAGEREPTKRRAVALRAEPPSDNVHGVFQFGDGPAIQPGDLIQAEGHETFWEVVSIVDRIVGGEYICLETRVKKRATFVAPTVRV